MKMTRRQIVTSVACLAALALCGWVVVAKPQPTTDAGAGGDRPVYVVVQGPEDSPPNVRTTHESGEASSPAKSPPPAHAPAHGKRRQFQYRYYPLARVYFAPDRGRYYWLSPRGWRVGTRLPKSITIDGEVAVVLEMDTDVPYTQHAKIEKAYPGRGRAKKKQQ
jgi:hypothetical protein